MNPQHMEQSIAPDLRDAEVLIVEDNPADARLIQTLLEESSLEPLHFTHFDHLAAARDWLEHNVADAVLLDLGLPDATGLESLNTLMRDTQSVPVVIVSGSDDERLRREAVERGAVDFVVKDRLDPERLARSVRSALEQSRLTTELGRARRSARLAQAELSELVVQLEIPVVVIAPDHRILYANDAAGRLFGTEAPRLRGTALAIPVERTRSSQVELTDTKGLHHELMASAVPAHWRGHPAYFVMFRPNDFESAQEAKQNQRDALRATLSEIGAHALHLSSALACVERHHERLIEIGEMLMSPPHGDLGQRRRAAARRRVLLLAREAREALAVAQDDLVRLRRLAMFAQRSMQDFTGNGEQSTAYGSGAHRIESGRSRKAQSIGAIIDDVCRSVHGSFGSDVHIVTDTNAAQHFPASPANTREIVTLLLTGLVTLCRELNAGALKLRIRTSGATNYVVVSVDAFPDERIDEYRARVLAQLVGESNEAPLPDLARASAAIRDAGGNLRCGSGDDGRLWLQISLPDRGPN